MNAVNPESLRAPYDLVSRAADYPEWDGARPERCYLICTNMRCGSTLLGEALHRAGGFGCPLEYFHAGFRPRLEERWGTGSESAYVSAVYRYRTDPTGALGVKLFWRDVIELCRARHPNQTETLGADLTQDHHAAREVDSLVSETVTHLFPNPRFVFLTRRDRLRQAVSTFIGGQTRVWRWIPGVEEKPAAAVPEYDYDRICAFYEDALYSDQQWERWFRRSGISPFRLSYEELAADYTRAVADLLCALGRPEAPVPPPRMRRQANALSERFVRRFLNDHLGDPSRGATSAPAGT